MRRLTCPVRCSVAPAADGSRSFGSFIAAVHAAVPKCTAVRGNTNNCCTQTVPERCCRIHAHPCAGRIQLVWSQPFESEQTAWEELVFVLDENAQRGKTQCLCQMTWSVATVQQQLADVRSRSTISCTERDRRISIRKMLAGFA